LAGFLPGLPLAGDVFADIDVHGTRTDRLSGRLAARIAQARVGELALDAFTLAATMDAGAIAAAASARHEGATLTLHGTGSPPAATPTYALALAADRLPARMPGAPWWAPLAGRAGAGFELNVKGTDYADASLEVTGRIHGHVGDVSLAGSAKLGRSLDWELR